MEKVGYKVIFLIVDILVYGRYKVRCNFYFLKYLKYVNFKLLYMEKGFCINEEIDNYIINVFDVSVDWKIFDWFCLILFFLFVFKGILILEDVCFVV